MNAKYRLPQEDFYDWICPDLREYWQLFQIPDSDQIILKAIPANRQFLFSLGEGYALQYFTGTLTARQIQNRCQQLLPNIDPNLVVNLLHKLISLEILAMPTDRPPAVLTSDLPPFKPSVEWICHPDGYWLLRNPEDVTFLQVSDRHYQIIEQLRKQPIATVAQAHHLSQEELRYLVQLLTATAMFIGTKKTKHSPPKFNPLQLLYLKFPLFNPDPWLTNNIDKLRWIWTTPVFLTLGFFLALSAAVGLKESSEIFFLGQHLWTYQKDSTILPFVLLMVFVISIHELGHAFTLKHYGGIVPEIGLMFMCLMPGCYTNTTDAYCLVKRRQRTLVVAAGVMVQLIIWATALWLWNAAAEDSWLHTASYLLMVAALFTVAINLNPLSKFDGYYLAVAVSGINNLRSRSFSLYANFLRGKPIEESGRDRLILAAYAPFSLAYTLLVFGHLLLWLGEWAIANIPIFALLLIILWLIYANFPTSSPRAAAHS